MSNVPRWMVSYSFLNEEHPLEPGVRRVSRPVPSSGPFRGLVLRHKHRSAALIDKIRNAPTSWYFPSPCLRIILQLRFLEPKGPAECAPARLVSALSVRPGALMFVDCRVTNPPQAQRSFSPDPCLHFAPLSWLLAQSAARAAAASSHLMLPFEDRDWI